MRQIEHTKAVLVDWLIKFGTDWVDYKRVRESGLQMEIGRLERMKYVEYEWADDAPIETGEIKYKLTDKGLALLKENA